MVSKNAIPATKSNNRFGKNLALIVNIGMSSNANSWGVRGSFVVDWAAMGSQSGGRVSKGAGRGAFEFRTSHKAKPPRSTCE